MRIVKTQKILYNREFRIRLLADNTDPEYVRLVRKLPDCRWSNQMNSWHTNQIDNHILHFNKIFPSHIRFCDISATPYIPKIDENLSDKRICIVKNIANNTLKLKFLYDHELEILIQKSGGFLLPGKNKEWKLKNTEEIHENLKSYLLKANYRIDYESDQDESEDSSMNQKCKLLAEENFRKHLVSLNYQKRTIDQYVSHISRYFESTGLNSIFSIECIRDFIDEMSINRNYSRSYQNQLINSLKVYCRYKYGHEIGRYELPRPRRDSLKPTILTKNEVSKIINHIPNLKHNTIIYFIYQTGITVSETVSIRPEDVHKDKMQIFIRGRKDDQRRKVPMSNKLLEKIEYYQNCYNPKNYLFEGYKGSQYSERNIQKVLKKYVQKAGINKKAGAQTLRHSFACNLASEGIEIGELQHLLGHSCRKSTEIYRKMVENEDIG